MIKASDLRLGNWVMYGTHRVKVRSVTERHIGYDVGCFSAPASLQPIVLTPELLGKIKEFNIKLGDGIGMEVGGQGLLLVCYSHTPNKVFLMMHDRDDDRVDAIDTEIMYLHTLQNLYYALTGTELEITL